MFYGGLRNITAGRSVVDEQKETAKKITSCNEHSLSQTCRTLKRSTRQKKTISFPAEHTYISPWRQHTQVSTTQKVLTKVLPRGILKGGGDQAPRSVNLNPPVRENTGPVKRGGPCASNVERRGESAWKKPGAKQIEVKKNGLSANLTSINRFRDRSPNVTIPRKPEQKNESRSVPDRATGNGINKPSTPNVGCNRSETRAIRSAGLSGARASTTPLKPCDRKVTGYSMKNSPEACIENSSSILKFSGFLAETQLGERLPPVSAVINAAAQKSPCLATDANRVPVGGKPDEIIFSHEFPKIISDYLKGVGYTQIIAGTMGNAAKQKTASFVETLCNLVHPIVAEELQVYGKLYCTLAEKKSIIETVIKGFNERVRNSEQWKSIEREENEIQC
uniref:Uncharacterized protein n=1 Tax=Ascaris lumbricoides TaxID=6252 RepID=A0A9J2PLT4_ASCLU